MNKSYAVRCLERALASGHKTWIQQDGSIKIASDSEPGVARHVTFEQNATFIQLHCDCPAGTFHEAELVPCKHAALAGRRLVKEGLAVQVEGGIFCVAPEQLEVTKFDHPEDVLEGLPTP